MVIVHLLSMLPCSSICLDDVLDTAIVLFIHMQPGLIHDFDKAELMLQ